MALLFITHDLNLVQRFPDRVGVMERGRLVETGRTADVFSNPQHAYTRRLLASRPVRVVQPIAPTRRCWCRRATSASRSASRAAGSRAAASRRCGARPAAEPRRDARHRRRIGVGQDDARHGAARAAADRERRDRGRRVRVDNADRQVLRRDAAAHAGRVPGPVRVAQPAHDGRPDRRRGSRPAPARARRRPSAMRWCCRCSTRSA